jgi:hypothetical protein
VATVEAVNPCTVIIRPVFVSTALDSAVSLDTTSTIIAEAQ